MAFIYQHMLGTTEEWERSTRIIPDGELVIEECSDGTRKIKIGDGKKRFNSLPYVYDLSALDEKFTNSALSLQKQIDQLIANDYPTNPDDLNSTYRNVEEEVANARINSDGTVHPSIGSHIRSVSETINNLSTELESFKGAEAVSGLLYEDNELSLVSSSGNIIGNTVTIIGGTGGGGGSASSSTTLKNKMNSTKLTVINSVPTELRVEFYEKMENEFTGIDGTLSIEYSYDNGKTYTTLELTENEKIIPQNVEHPIFIPTKILTANKEVKVKITVTGGAYGILSNALTYILIPVEGSLTSTFKDSLSTGIVYTGSFTYNYTCNGRGLNKTVYFEMDGEVFDSDYVGLINGSGGEKIIEISNFSHGAHKLSVYFKTDQGAKSNIETYDILYEEKNNRSPILAARALNTSVNQGNPISIIYKAYTPNNSSEVTPEILVKIYDEKNTLSEEILTNVDRKINTFTSYDYKISNGVIYISFSVLDKTLAVVPVTILPNTTDYDLTQVTSGLVYSYKSYDINTQSEEKNIYMYPYQFDNNSSSTNIIARNIDFNWKSNGFNKDPADPYLRLMGPARHIVELPILTSSYNDGSNIIRLDGENDAAVIKNGRTIELEFRVSNVSDISAEIIKYKNENGVGFIVTPVYAALLPENVNLITDGRTGFIKNEEVVPCAYIQKGQRIRVSFVIEQLGTITNNYGVSGQCVNIYINGEFAQSLPYDKNTSFISNANLEIGHDSCITDLYEVRMYRRALSPSEILQNYNTGFATTAEKINQLEYNDVLIENSTEGTIGNLSYYKLIKKYPCVLVTGSLSPNKEDKYYAGLIFTKPSKDSEDGYTTEFSLMDYTEETDSITGNKRKKYISYNKVQGTSSVKFPVKNYKFYLRKLSSEGEEKKVKYSLKGKDESGKDKSIPVSTLCWKADYMSSDHANTFNANIADSIFDKDTEAQKLDSRVQNTIWGFRCLVFQRDDEDSVIKFIGDGALNNDKGNSEVFGLEIEGEELTVKGKIGKYSDNFIAISEAQIVTSKDDSAEDIEFLDAINLVKDYENNKYTDSFYYVKGLFSYTIDNEEITKCLTYETEEEEINDDGEKVMVTVVHKLYLPSLKDNNGIEYEKLKNRPQIADCGYLTTRQKWEFSNNSESICTWESDAFLELDDQGNKLVVKALEASYPDQGDLDDAGLEADYTALQLAFTWVCQRANYWDEIDPEKKAIKRNIFIKEFEKHFNKHHALVYYLFMEYIGLCDNRAKNFFLRTEQRLDVSVIRANGVGKIGEEIPYNKILTELYKDNNGNPVNKPNPDIIDWEKSNFAKWICDLYDLDSGFGVDNNGYLHIPYYAEWDFYLFGYNETEKTYDYKFNGRESRFWLMVEDAFANDIKTEFQKLAQRDNNALNFESIYNQHITNNAKLICQNVVNKDMITKYSNPWEFGYYNPEYKNPDGTKGAYVYDNQYKYIQRGSRTAQKIDFLSNRSTMLYSKYESTKFAAKSLDFTFRVGKTIAGEDLVIKTKYSNALYPSVTFGDSGTKMKANKFIPGDDAVELSGSNGMKTSDTIYIHGGQYITEISDISDFLPYEVQLQNMANLKKLYIGKFNDPTYKNTATNVISNIGNCTLLDTIDISGYTNIVSADFSKNYLLRELYAARTDSLTTLTLPEGGSLEKIYIGDTQNISLVELPKLKIFERSGYEKLSTLRIENCPNINIFDILNSKLNNGVKLIRKPLQGIRLSGINIDFNDLIGDRARLKNEYIEILSDLNTPEYCLGRFMDEEGNTGSNTDGYKNEYPFIKGTIIYPDVISENSEGLNSKLYGELHEKYPDLKIIGFQSLDSYLTIYDHAGNPLDSFGTNGTVKVQSYNGNPGEYLFSRELKKPSTAQYDYKFLGLSTDRFSETPEFKLETDEFGTPRILITDIYGLAKLYPIFEPQIKSYTVSFYNGDKDKKVLLKQKVVQYGENAVYDDDPSDNIDEEKLLIRPGDGEMTDENGDPVYSFEFSGWYPSPENITGNRDCYAQYSFTYSNYFEIPLSHIEYEKIKVTDSEEDPGEIRITEYIAIPPDIGDTKYVDETIARLQPTYNIKNENDEVILPYNVTEILGRKLNDDSVVGFRNSGISIIELPDTLNIIGADSFRGCNSLMIANIPENVTKIYSRAFSECNNINTINYNAKNAKNILDNSLYQSNNMHSNCPFVDCNNPNGFTLNIGPMVESIPEYLFYAGSILSNNRVINNVRITDTAENPSSLTTIGAAAFYRSGLTDINFPRSLKIIYNQAFYENNNIEVLDLSNTQVERISEGAFSHWSALKTIKLPSTLKTLDGGAFEFGESAPSSIENIYIGNNQKFKVLTSINDNETINHSLVEITSTNSRILKLATNNTVLSTSDNISEIETDAFSGIRNIKNIKLPNGITTINTQAFQSCIGLESIEFPNTIKKIGNSAFAWCRKLANVSIPKDASLTLIDDQAFYDCDSLKEIVLPENITKLKKIFGRCMNLETVTILSKNPNLSQYNLEINQKVKNAPALFSIDCRSLKEIRLGWTWTPEEEAENNVYVTRSDGKKLLFGAEIDESKPLGSPGNPRIIYGYSLDE